MRIRLETIAVLERAGLALVGIDGDQSRLRRALEEAPLSSCGEARATKSAKAGSVDDVDYLVTIAFAVSAGVPNRIAIVRPVGI